MDDRVLVLLPTARDGERTRAALAAAGFGCCVCADLADLCQQIAVGAGVALLTEEALVSDHDGCLAAAIAQQPAWSDLPLVLVARATALRPRALRESMNVSLVDRPVRLRSLLSVLRAALRSRRYQYAIRDHLAEGERQADTLRRSEEALREADRRKDDFLALLAHELRNPLAPLRNGLQVLRLSQDAAMRERARDMMDRQLGHMVRLIDDLLDVSRINRDKMELRRARVDLSDAVQSAIETVRPAIDAADHVLSVELPAEPVTLDADPTRLAQVFGNLLSNSAKYTPRGGQIGLAARREGDAVLVTVRDSGIGIPAASLPRIFDMFSQVDRSIERATGGLGIGLALVKGLVEMHGGTVSAASEGLGRGAEFTVRLPVAARAAARQASGGPQVGPAGQVGPGGRILVVDDNRDAAESMAEMLRLLGSEVALAHDGIEAVERAGAWRPGIVLMDVGMPRLNGLDATRRIRAQPFGRDMTIIALTGWGQDNDRLRSRQAGCDGHLVKPVQLADLVALLRRVGDQS